MGKKRYQVIQDVHSRVNTRSRNDISRTHFLSSEIMKMSKPSIVVDGVLPGISDDGACQVRNPTVEIQCPESKRGTVLTCQN